MVIDPYAQPKLKLQEKLKKKFANIHPKHFGQWVATHCLGFKLKHLITILGALNIFVISTFIFSWLFFHETSPKEVIEYFKNIDFDRFIQVFIFLIFLLVASNISFLILKIAKKRFYFWSFAASNILIIFSLVGIILGAYVFKHPILQTSYPEYNQYMSDYSRPLEVVFNVPVKTAKLDPKIVPDFKGEWKWEPYLGVDGITRKGSFYPEETVFPESRFVVYITGINKLTDSKEHEYGFVFKAPTLPELISTSPEQDSTTALRNDSIVLKIDKYSKDLVDWNFALTPSVPFEIKFEGNDIVIDPIDVLEQGQSYTLDVFYRPKIINLETEEVLKLGDPIDFIDLRFITVNEPLIDSFSPNGSSVLPDEIIRVKFKEPMDRESVEDNFTIEPAIAGEIIWDDDFGFYFQTESELPKETQFTIKLKSGSKNQNGGVLESEIVHQFRTIGKVIVTDWAPANGSYGVSEYTRVQITFDQEVDQALAQEHFTIAPYVAGSFAWEGNTLNYNLGSALSYETTYTFKISAGVKSVKGLDGDQEFSSSFTVRSNLVLFYIPIFYQPPGFACNIFTARMVLAWKGFGSDHVSLINEIGHDDNRSGDNWTGNPYVEYVGNSDGSWGYGTYYGPIQQIFSNRGIGSEAHVGWNVSEMAKAVEQGHPVIIWRYNGVGGGQNISWTSDDGTYVYAFNGMHGSVITGFIGPSDNPTSFYINDPWLGQFWMDAGTLDAYWSYSNRMSLVVF